MRVELPAAAAARQPLAIMYPLVLIWAIFLQALQAVGNPRPGKPLPGRLQNKLLAVAVVAG